MIIIIAAAAKSVATATTAAATTSISETSISKNEIVTIFKLKRSRGPRCCIAYKGYVLV